MIGIIDSGLGGLTIYHAIKAQLPNVPVYYYADSENFPLGNKTAEQIREKTAATIQTVVEAGATVVVLACHTAAIHVDVALFDVPIVSVATNAVNEVKKNAALSRIALLGTRATIESFYFQEHLSGKELFPITAPLFVQLVEEGLSDSPLADAVAYTYLEAIKKKEVDAILLACTHFPFIKDSIARVLGSGVMLIDPTQACAAQTILVAGEQNLTEKEGPDILASSGRISHILESYKRGYSHGSKIKTPAH